MRYGIIPESPVERIGLASGMVPAPRLEPRNPMRLIPGGQGPGLQIADRAIAD